MRWRYVGLLLIIIVGAAGSGAAQAVQAAQPTPWADRGWVDKGDSTYDNPKHGFHLIVPTNWLIDREDRYPSTYLWSMAKFNTAGNLRVQLAIHICPCQVKTAEEFFNNQLASSKEPPTSSQIQLMSSGPTSRAGVYEMQFIYVGTNLRLRNLYFLRKGTPYVVAFLWAPDARADELAELDSVRRVMDLPAPR